MNSRLRINHRDTFIKVLVNCDNQIIVRELLNKVMNETKKQEVIDGFNKYADERNSWVCDDPIIPLPPEPPAGRMINNNLSGFCVVCRSSVRRHFPDIWVKSCINPKCSSHLKSSNA